MTSNLNKCVQRCVTKYQDTELNETYFVNEVKTQSRKKTTPG